MKIVVCGSMIHYEKMVDIKNQLVGMGHKVVLPSPGKSHHLRAIHNNKYVDTYRLKKKYNYIYNHYKHIRRADCILITNWDKGEVKNYIGGNAFLEMGFAHILGKPVYVLNEIPNIDLYFHEMKAIVTDTLQGNIRKLEKKNFGNIL